jgi:hypothetical protein
MALVAPASQPHQQLQQQQPQQLLPGLLLPPLLLPLLALLLLPLLPQLVLLVLQAQAAALLQLRLLAVALLLLLLVLLQQVAVRAACLHVRGSPPVYSSSISALSASAAEPNYLLSLHNCDA